MAEQHNTGAAVGVVDSIQPGGAPDSEALGAASPIRFTAIERDFVRCELGMRFGQYPLAADGLYLKTWRGGPLKGEPKLPPAVKSMLERGLVDIRRAPLGAVAMFTKACWAALRMMAQDRRALDPTRYAHIRRELGLNEHENESQ